MNRPKNKATDNKSTTQHRYNVLCIDDDEMILYILKRQLKKKYNIFLATLPNHAWEIIEKNDINLVMSDHSMYEITGIEFLKQVQIKYPDISRILITGNNEPEVIKKAINEAEINHFISKPWEEDALNLALDKTLEIYQLRQDNILLNTKLSDLVQNQKATLQRQGTLLKANLNTINQLNKSKEIQEGNLQESFKEITETLSKALGFDRVSIWNYNHTRSQSILCDNLFANGTHKQGYVMKMSDYPNLKKVILNGWILQEANVHTSTSNNLPPLPYLQKHNIEALIYMPFYIVNDLYGILVCEMCNTQEQWLNHEIQFIVNITDVIKIAYSNHERKIAENKLKVAYKELQTTHKQLLLSEKMASLGQLTAGVAHEINNPINFVYAGINALEINFERYNNIVYNSETNHNTNPQITTQFEELKNDIESLIRDIRVGATRTAEIVKSLKSFSRIDEVEFKLSDIHEGINSTLLLLNSKFRDRIVIHKDYDNTIGLLPCNLSKINQVFMNVIFNAADAIPDKGDIFITTRLEGKYATISIKDNGIGMDDETKNKIFDPFFSTKDVGEGTGLGMSISYGIIENHKGFMHVNSIKGEGSEIIIQLPHNNTQ